MLKKIYKQLDSTNSKAQEILDSGDVKASFWVQAEDQFAGRGLGPNTWISEPGKNITGSLVIFPSNFNAEKQFQISMAASLAVIDLLNLFFEDVKIKWPNDILVDSSKIAGLLVEHAIVGSKISHSIIGLGININQESFPDSIPRPISFKMKLSINLDIEELTQMILVFLDTRLNQVNNNLSHLKSEYISFLYRYKEYAPYRSLGQWFRARIIGVDEFGQLVLETESGDVKRFGFKEVEFIQ